MIRSMTAFANARTELEAGSITMELRSVNNRYLDLQLRIPEELRFSEPAIRELLSQHLQRGKVELRVNFQRAFTATSQQISPELLQQVAQQLHNARTVIADIPAPRLGELIALSQQEHSLDQDVWLPAIQSNLRAALDDLENAKQREGSRLAEAMLATADEMTQLVDAVETHLPELLSEHQKKVTQRLTEALAAVSPDGFAQISGTELSARIAQESSLFSLRIDVAEEITRLRSHIQELRLILNGNNSGKNQGKTRQGSVGKRLDFLFQEMNREANTLGSKAGSIEVTRTAIDLKLLIEQMREQAQNIE